MKEEALVLIDIQNIYFTKGIMQLHEPEKTAQNARKILDYFREKSLPWLP